MVPAPLRVDRAHVLAFRRRTAALDERLPAGPGASRRAAWAGLCDSMPRAALLQLHARVTATPSTALDDPALVQVWGLRFSTYTVPAADHALFTVARTLPDAARRAEAVELAERLAVFLDGRETDAREAARAIDAPRWGFRYAATTGRLLIRWDGAHQPTVRTVPTPDVGPDEARHELARRYLHVMGPATPEGFRTWAGLPTRTAGRTFERLRPELVPVRTDLGDAWALASDEAQLRRPPDPPALARLLPSGDTYTLLQGRDRELLVPDPARRAELWTPRVWPGAVVVRGEVAGTWRRAEEKVTVRLWVPLDDDAREAVEAEATSMPLPGLRAPVSLRWVD